MLVLAAHSDSSAAASLRVLPRENKASFCASPSHGECGKLSPPSVLGILGVALCSPLGLQFETSARGVRWSCVDFCDTAGEPARYC